MLSTSLARALLWTRAVDWAYRMFDRARSELIAALASDAVLDDFNDVAYGGSGFYRPEAAAFRAELFPWEEETIERFFPKPPAHVLIGGAGGGRESFALVGMGYRVTAFEPSEQLAEVLALAAPDHTGLAVYRGGYEDLPHLARVGESPEADLDALGPFDASIVGWGSFSHLRTDDLRVATLEAFARVTRGPILVSFLGLYGGQRLASSRLAKLRRALPRRAGRGLADVFSVYIGFYHRTSEEEIADLASRSGLQVEYGSFDERDTNWPHVILIRAEDGEDA
jgi:hypothetical protein